MEKAQSGQEIVPPPVSCPVCGCAKARTSLCPVVLSGTEPVYALVACSGCGTRMLDPLPTGEELARFYAPRYYGGDWYKQRGKGRMFRRVLLPKVGGCFLDVGCSLGFFLLGVAEDRRWRAFGSEISPEAAAFARDRLGLDVRCGELADLGYPDRFFDYVHVSNVLEHVRDPRGLLGECRRILKPGGTLYLSVPNGPVDSAGLVRYHCREGLPPRSKDGHLFFFSRDALRVLFRACGFAVVETHTYGIRRGLRALGLYPRKPGWKNPYRPQAPSPATPEIRLPAAPGRLPGYDAYRFRQARLKRLPGLRAFGLDFEIILRAEEGPGE